MTYKFSGDSDFRAAQSELMGASSNPGQSNFLYFPQFTLNSGQHKHIDRSRRKRTYNARLHAFLGFSVFRRL